MPEKSREETLVENRLEYLKRSSRRVDTSHEDGDDHYRDLSDIVDYFATRADPSDKKVYTQWILDKYGKGQFRQRDADRVLRALTNFHANKDRLAQRDINRYKSLAELEAIEPAGRSRSAVKREGADLVYDSPTMSVHHIKTMEAACRYGAGTRWCTNSRDPAENEFEDYDKRGPLYVVRKKDEHKRYQVHLDTPLIQDESRRELTPHQLSREAPETSRVREFTGHPIHGYAFNPDRLAARDQLARVLSDKSLRVEHKLVAASHPEVRAEMLSDSIARHQAEPTSYIYLFSLLHQRPPALRREHVEQILDYPYKHPSPRKRVLDKAREVLMDKAMEVLKSWRPSDS